MTAIHASVLDLHQHLPPYSSLLNPTTQYDYLTHSLIPLDERRVFQFTPPLKGVVNKEKLKMRYKSLLSDVSRTRSILSLKISNLVLLQIPDLTPSPALPSTIYALPFEITAMILYYVNDHESYLSLMQVNKFFYKLTKPLLYESLVFTSTYRFAQFVTLVRLDHSVGYLVKSLDMSQLQSNFDRLTHLEEAEAVAEIAEAEVQPAERPAEPPVDQPGTDGRREVPDTHRYISSSAVDNFQDWAGWREWKFLKNPLYRPVVPLTKYRSRAVSTGTTALSVGTRSSVHSSRSFSASFSASLSSFFSLKPSLDIKRFLKKRKHVKKPSRTYVERHNVVRLEPVAETLDLSASRNVRASRSPAHPLSNNILREYINAKDVPIGSLLHVIHLCPNLEYLNLSKLVLSVDYQILEVSKFLGYDVGSTNYPKDLTVHTANIMRQSLDELLRTRVASSGSDAASVYSPSFVSHRKTESPYLDADMTSITYVNDFESLYSVSTPVSRGYSQLYLSDLNLKSINPISLVSVSQKSVLTAIKDCCFRLQRLELQSLTWLNKKILSEFVGEASASDLRELDLTNAGMSKNLNWTKNLTVTQLRYLLLSDENREEDLLEEDENNHLMVRRGRIGETYIV
ncbi:hypothetical protein BABINDRAFT_169152 [Babjeviella inositovora NRRL Y-12698]|uniref:F-box domain-containing protein n=1 Tax=Babjeviella inositovora NRRL Y-12698 TaxID=984486 RepID=A0A1E3QKE7_9ASCO|nr:uncharacterized protein BABINDRAFT_169152 [Babjeviella inositovora NRRL Y-12698]ODQ77552.1 hypothetical protein BABINDRAFT_169152 [Babjeviella inositovora NRRL Y-12698]